MELRKPPSPGGKRPERAKNSPSPPRSSKTLRLHSKVETPQSSDKASEGRSRKTTKRRTENQKNEELRRRHGRTRTGRTPEGNRFSLFSQYQTESFQLEKKTLRSTEIEGKKNMLAVSSKFEIKIGKFSNKFSGTTFLIPLQTGRDEATS
ncbi:hypothetical protein YC2023_030892 [Brassica napus]